MATYLTGTGTGFFFSEQTADLLRRLQGDDSPQGRELTAEAKRLAALFEGWLTLRPDPDAKAAAIRSLFDLNRAVLEHCGAASGFRPTNPRLYDEDDE